MGCGYCAWACPYGAPQYIAEQGVMTKCNFCFDNLDAGLPPACVAACPLRVLDFKAVEETSPAAGLPGAVAAPGERTSLPAAALFPHRAAPGDQATPGDATPLEKQVANREEIQPGAPEKPHRMAAFAELPLVAFTLLAQMAAGMAVCSLALPALPLPLLLSIGVLLGRAG